MGGLAAGRVPAALLVAARSAITAARRTTPASGCVTPDGDVGAGRGRGCLQPSDDRWPRPGARLPRVRNGSGTFAPGAAHRRAAACAASISPAPPATASAASSNRCHRRYDRIGVPTDIVNRCERRLDDTPSCAASSPMDRCSSGSASANHAALTIGGSFGAVAPSGHTVFAGVAAAAQVEGEASLDHRSGGAGGRTRATSPSTYTSVASSAPVVTRCGTFDGTSTGGDRRSAATGNWTAPPSTACQPVMMPARDAHRAAVDQPPRPEPRRSNPGRGPNPAPILDSHVDTVARQPNAVESDPAVTAGSVLMIRPGSRGRRGAR